MLNKMVRSSLRRRILTFVGALVAMSLLGSTVSLYRINEVGRSLDAINRVSIPLGRLIVQLQSDAEIYSRELERGLGSSHWNDSHWSPRPIPRWIEDVIQSEVDRIGELAKTDSKWQDWSNTVNQGLVNLKKQAAQLHSALEHKDETQASQVYPLWISTITEWKRHLQWGASEYDRSLRHTFSLAESKVSELNTGLEAILVVVALLSLALLWLGERALRPLEDLTRLAREIARRGLRKEDKSGLPELFLSRKDEVSQLAREFHSMATALLERERALEAQKNRVQEQNRLLREMGALNENVLNSIESVLIVTDLEGVITQCNPIAAHWLSTIETPVQVIGSNLADWTKLKEVLSGRLEKRLGENFQKIDPVAVEGRIYGGNIMPLRGDSGAPHGAIIVLYDLTEEIDLQERLKTAEKMAAVGRMSAQVAHEVRNPLHSIGLEAEIAVELASRLGNANLKQSLQSILSGVDRLQNITENYLKLSRLSSGEKEIIDLGEVLESVLATYTSVCEDQGVRVDWERMPRSVLKICGDRNLLEQVFGNLFRNSLQALENLENQSSRNIVWKMGNTETGRVWIRISDNGPGIAEEVRNKLFVPFVTTRAQGTGLGLSFIKKVIEDHGGMVRYIESDVGACFEIVIPPADHETYHDLTLEEVRLQ